MLWTLHEVGAVEELSGRAPAVLAGILAERDGPYAVRAGERTMTTVLSRIRTQYPHALVSDRNATRTFGLSCPLDAAELPQPNPYAAGTAEPKPKRGRPRKAPPSEAVELVELDEAPQGVSAHDALLAVAGFVASAMKLAGIAEDMDADERLTQALEDNRRLQELLDHQGAQLLTKMRENEVLQRALAGRNGARVRT